AAGTQQHIGWGNYRRPVEDENQQIEVDVMEVGPEYPQTMGLRLKDGRFFDESRMEADLARSILVNRKFVEAFGWPDPIGNVITIYDTTRLTVIGVVDDYFVGGLWRAVEPAMIRLAEKGKYYSLAVRTEAENLPEVLEFCRETWTEMLPNYPFNGIAQEETLQEEKTINKSIKQLFVFLAIVAIILSLIGLYTLVSLNIVSRIKEIGIRKVLGAPIGAIISLLSRRFMLLLLIASAFGAFGAYFLSDMLLDSIWDYYLDMTPGLFIWSILIMFLIAVVTISGLVYKAANQNPVDSLRYE
ncbi:MAG: FtsX-like permease family protein, partial [Bacteroidota bacterium]|nr:FtsX-like permease family protein [Bacteroidota bacterium]